MRTGRISLVRRKIFSLLGSAVFPRKPFSLKETKLFGIRFLLYMDQRTCQKIYLRVFERAETKFLQTTVKYDDICLDIGANIGYYSFLLASKARKVIAIEPVRVNADLIRLTSSLNNLNNVEIICAAAGAHDGETEFAESDESGYSSVKFEENLKTICEEYDTSYVSIYKVPTITIDSLNLERLDIVKIDVEGYEYVCLQGMKNTLQTLKPRLVMAELVDYHLKRFGHEMRSFIELIDQLGYMPRVLKNGGLVEFKGQFVPNDNLFFVHKDKRFIP